MQEEGFVKVPFFLVVTKCSLVDKKVSKKDDVTIFRDEVYRQIFIVALKMAMFVVDSSVSSVI